jgi:excisionase family DNA binding protein
MTNTPTKLLTVGEFAEVLNVSVACVRRWILERKIAYAKVGRLVRIQASEVDRLIAQGMRPAREVRRG